jgi:hypothetical protein
MLGPMDEAHPPADPPTRPAAYVVVRDIAASWASYPSWGLARDGEEVPGLLLHAAGPTDEGVRTVEVWSSPEHCRSHDEAHGPGVPAGLAVPPTERALVVLHLATAPPAQDPDRPPDHGGPPPCTRSPRP